MGERTLEDKAASSAPQSRFWHRFCTRRKSQFLESHANLAAILYQRLTNAPLDVMYISRAFVQYFP